jgi:hypothetical protein
MAGGAPFVPVFSTTGIKARVNDTAPELATASMQSFAVFAKGAC